MLRVLTEFIWCHFFSEIINKNFTPKMGYFGFFQLIKNYAETTLLNDMNSITGSLLRSTTKFKKC